MPLLKRPHEPLHGQQRVALGAYAIGKCAAQQILRRCMAFGGGTAEPVQRFFKITFDAVAVGIHQPDLVLRDRVAYAGFGQALLEAAVLERGRTFFHHRILAGLRQEGIRRKAQQNRCVSDLAAILQAAGSGTSVRKRASRSRTNCGVSKSAPCARTSTRRARSSAQRAASLASATACSS